MHSLENTFIKLCHSGPVAFFLYNSQSSHVQQGRINSYSNTQTFLSICPVKMYTKIIKVNRIIHCLQSNGTATSIAARAEAAAFATQADRVVSDWAEKIAKVTYLWWRPRLGDPSSNANGEHYSSFGLVFSLRKIRKSARSYKSRVK